MATEIAQLPDLDNSQQQGNGALLTPPVFETKASWVPEDDHNEYLLLLEEEDLTSESSADENEQYMTQQNANDIFYLIRHNKGKFIRHSFTTRNPLKINTTNNTRITPVMSATIFCRHGILKLLLSRPDVRVNSHDEHEMSALLYGANNGDQRCLKYLLTAGADPAHHNTEKRNVLHLLLLRRHFNTVLYLLEFPHGDAIRDQLRGLLNQRDIYGMTPLLYACELGHRDLCKYFVQLGADAHIVDMYGRDALCHAIQSKSSHLVKYFIEELDFNPNHIYTHANSYTPLFYAAQADCPETIDLLLHYKADLHHRDTAEGETPLLHAARHAKIHALFALLFNGANIQDTTNTGANIMLYLIRNGFREELSYVYALMKQKTKPISPYDLQSIYNTTHLIRSEELYAHLREIKDKQGFTSLIHAVLGDNADAVRFLLHDVKCDIKTGDTSGRSALYHAVANRHVGLFELLIGAGADVNTQDQDRNTVLMHAVDSNNTSFVDSLLSKGANINVTNKDNWSVLTFAAKTGNYELLSLLVNTIRANTPHASEASPLLTERQLSLALNVACVYGQPVMGKTAQGTTRNHLQIISDLLHRSSMSTNLFHGCQYPSPNAIFPGLEPCIIAAVRNSGDKTSIVEELFRSPNTVLLTVQDKNGYTPTLLAVSLQYPHVTQAILSFELNRFNNVGGSSNSRLDITAAANGGSGVVVQHVQQQTCSIQCPAGLTPADHACIARHEKTFIEILKRNTTQHTPKQNQYKVSFGELLALGKKFASYLQHIHSLSLPFVEYESMGNAVRRFEGDKILTPLQVVEHNEKVLTEVDNVFLKDQNDAQERFGYAIGTSLYHLNIPEQSTYSAIVKHNGQRPTIPEELVREMQGYTQFFTSTRALYSLLEESNKSRPQTSKIIPVSREMSQSLIWYCVVASKNVPLLLALLDVGNFTPKDGNNNNKTSPTNPTMGPGNARGMVRPPIARPGQPGKPGGLGMMKPGGAASNALIVGQTSFLRVDNINNQNSTLLEVLFAFAGYQGCSVSGTAFLYTAITAAKYSNYWDPEYIFVNNGTRYNEKRGKTIRELAEAYELPSALELALKPVRQIEEESKQKTTEKKNE